MSWEEHIINYNIPDSKHKLIHDVERLHFSVVASQLYCEKKVELELIHGKEETQEMKTGTVLHDELLPVEKVQPDILVEKIKSVNGYICIFPVYFTHRGHVVSGIHDGVIFYNGKPRYILEIKTSKSAKALKSVYLGQKLQAILYAIALERMGFDTMDLTIVIPKILQDVNKESFTPELREYLSGKRKSLQEKFGEKIKIHTFPYSENEKKWALNTLENLEEFWIGSRPATGSDSWIKCKYCDFKETCELSRVRH